MVKSNCFLSRLALNGKIFTGKFKWDLGGNISFVKNKLLDLIDGKYLLVQRGKKNYYLITVK
jgi:hypothetical protein